jgi:hypothetical protein
MWVNYCEEDGECFYQEKREDYADIITVLTSGKPEVDVKISSQEFYFTGKYMKHIFSLQESKEKGILEGSLYIFFKKKEPNFSFG